MAFTPLTTEEESTALAYGPFEGEEDVKTLIDKFVRGRLLHECLNCADEIKIGERHRALKQRNNESREIRTFRFCCECCKAYAHADDDGLQAWCKRYAVGQAIFLARRAVS